MTYGFLCIVICAACGCGSPAPKDVPSIPAQDQLKNLVLGYARATSKLKRPPQNVEELKTHLKEFGDPNELLKSPTDGSEMVIGWGVDIMKQKNGQFILWAYEKNPHGENKRWVILGRFPSELTEEQVQNATFAPGLKKPN